MDNLHLTRSEMELLSLLAHGLNDGEIASIMGNTEQEIITSVEQLVAKTGARDRFELAILGVGNSKMGFGEPPKT